MKPMRGSTLVAAFLLVGAAPLDAQYGSGYSTASAELSPAVEVSYGLARQELPTGRAHWYQVLILWRGQAGWNQLIPSSRAASAQLALSAAEYDSARKKALIEDAMFLGGQVGPIGYFAVLDSGRTVLTILNRSFRVPARDSALVVLVDRTDGVGGPPVITDATVVDGRFTPDPPPKTWTSGDTTFTVRGPDRSREHLLMVLERSATARSFWR